MKLLQSQKLPWLLAILLALTNLGLVALLWMGPRPPHRHAPPKRALEAFDEALALDDGQKAAFSQELDAHFEGMKPKQDAIRDAKHQLFGPKGLQSNPEERQNLLSQLAQLETELLGYQLQHFQQLRSLCNASQQPKFDELIPKLIQNSPQPGNPPRR